MKIRKVTAEEILDSRGNPTILTTVELRDGSIGQAAVPSGISTGLYEVLELRDADTQRYRGLGVLKAIDNVERVLAQTVVGFDAEAQENIDNAMVQLDGTEDKSRLGANAILSISLAVARAEANFEKKELYDYLTKFNTDFFGTYIMPIPEMNVLNGAKHADWSTDIQEYMLFPIGAETFVEAVRINTEIYHTLKDLLKEKGYAVTLGDEGGFAPRVTSNEEPFVLLSEAIVRAKYILGKDVAFGIDVAASEFFQHGRYHLSKENKTLSSEELLAWYQQLHEKYPIVSWEDIFAQDDFEAFAKFTKTLGQKNQIVGDDLYATNVKRLQKGIDQGATNAILIKLNQVGTLTETIQTIQVARKNNLAVIISHRSGETDDTFIADLSVAMGAGQIKSGAPSRSERVGKYNRLMRIERQLREKAVFGKIPF